jgi:surfactin synthase thioesterase subunit
VTTRVIQSEEDREGLIKLIRSRDLPITVEVVQGKRRSTDQNRLQRRLIAEIAEQTGQEPEDVRAYAKLVIGVPILRADSELFAERYDATVKGLPYETKLALMREPLDLPITRLMTTAQKTLFLDKLAQHFAERGVVFTDSRREAA